MNLPVRRIKELHALIIQSGLDESTQIKLSESLRDGQDLGLLLDEQNPMLAHALDAQRVARCQRQREHRAYVQQHFLNHHCGVQPCMNASFQSVVCPACGFQQSVIGGGSSRLCFYWNQKVPGPVLAVEEIEFSWPKMGYMLEGRIRWPLILQHPKFEEDQILECIVHNVEKSEFALSGEREHVQMCMNLTFYRTCLYPECKTDSTTYRASLIKPKGAKAERAFLAELTEFYDWEVPRSRY